MFRINIHDMIVNAERDKRLKSGLHQQSVSHGAPPSNHVVTRLDSDICALQFCRVVNSMKTFFKLTCVDYGVGKIDTFCKCVQ